MKKKEEKAGVGEYIKKTKGTKEFTSKGNMKTVGEIDLRKRISQNNSCALSKQVQ